jgi:putative addiction module component (TIGR02574 family)
MKSLGIDRLGVDERLDLVEEIWDSIAAEGDLLTEAQRTELKRRYEDNEAHPNDLTSWEEVKAATLARLQK